MSRISRVWFQKLISSSFLTMSIRMRTARRWGITASSTARFYPGVEFGGPFCSIGDNSFINGRSFVESIDKQDGFVSIGNDVQIGMGCSIITSTHDIAGSKRRAGVLRHEPVIIEDGCWLGANVTVLPGVTIAKGCIIAAGAVVNKSTTADALYGGVPAKKIRDL